MEGCSRKDHESCPQLLDLISKDREWVLKRGGEGDRSHGSPEEKKLELRLGPPGEDWTIRNINNSNSCRERDESLHYLRYLSSSMASGGKRSFLESTGGEEQGWIMKTNGNQNQNQKQAGAANNNNNNNNNNGVIGGGGGGGSPWSSSSPGFHQVNTTQQQTKPPSFLQFQTSPPLISKESSQPCCTKVVDLQNTEKKAFSPASANTAVPNSSQKRSATAVVGWPPIRSFRKNLASSSSSKPATDSQGVVPEKIAGGEKPVEISPRKGLFVKINMDGVPIGRKVDLKAYDSYEKLSSAVDELFRDLLAAQRDSPAGGIQNKQEGQEKTITTGLLDGSGEYTLVYEDNEGDRVLVGDVPWHMFVSTVKRLRVLKSSELSALSLGSSKQGKVTHDSALK